jgi:bud site selection protein 31
MSILTHPSHPPGSRYIYDLYYEKEAISRALYDWLLKNGYADANLIAKWKKQGYEKLCCLRCIQTKETNFNSTCICRVPREQLKADQEIQCVSCGCRGCSSGD